MKFPEDVSTDVLTKRLTRNFDFGSLFMLMFFENFIEESKSNKPCKWVITKHFRMND